MMTWTDKRYYGPGYGPRHPRGILGFVGGVFGGVVDLARHIIGGPSGYRGRPGGHGHPGRKGHHGSHGHHGRRGHSEGHYGAPGSDEVRNTQHGLNEQLKKIFGANAPHLREDGKMGAATDAALHGHEEFIRGLQEKTGTLPPQDITRMVREYNENPAAFNTQNGPRLGPMIEAAKREYAARLSQTMQPPTDRGWETKFPNMTGAEATPSYSGYAATVPPPVLETGGFDGGSPQSAAAASSETAKSNQGLTGAEIRSLKEAAPAGSPPEVTTPPDAAPKPAPKPAVPIQGQ